MPSVDENYGVYDFESDIDIAKPDLTLIWF